MKLSVIVPVYSVEKYLSRCLDSLLRQGLEPDEWEVICVNDGSPDNCAAILEDYRAKYPDIFKVITQENQGLGGTRNIGTAVAQGEYIAFVDSDDYLIDGAYRYLLDHFCQDEKVDVLQFDYTHVYTDGRTLVAPQAKAEGTLSFDGNGAEAFNCNRLSYDVWTKFYRRSFLERHHIRFEYSFLEDIPFNLEVFRREPHLRIVTSNIYRYEQGNSNSLISTTNRERVRWQLRTILSIIAPLNRYVEAGHGIVLPAASHMCNVFLHTYCNKMLKARLDYREWKEYTCAIKTLPVHRLDVAVEGSWTGKAIASLKNLSVTSYVVYLLVAFFFDTLFLRVIRPRIIACHTVSSNKQRSFFIQRNTSK